MLWKQLFLFLLLNKFLLLSLGAAGHNEKAQAEVLLPRSTEGPPHGYSLQMLLVALIGDSLPQLLDASYFLTYKAIPPGSHRAAREAH